MTNEIYFEQMDEALEQFQEAMETLRPVIEAMLETIRQWWLEISERLRPRLAALWEWWTEIQREALYRRLRRLHLPHWLARFLAWRWPERWLPWSEDVA